jgi:serine protease
LTSFRTYLTRCTATIVAATAIVATPPALAQSTQLLAQLPAASSSADALPPRIVVKLRPGAEAGPPAAPGERAGAASKPSAAAIAALGARAGAALEHVRALSDGSHVFGAASTGGWPPAAVLVEALRGAPDVERVEEDFALSIQQLPNDPELARLWNLKAVDTASFGADFETAWASTTGQPGLVVAIIDTGVLPHPDLVGSGGTLSPPTGALASDGYDFISDCRVRASCPAGTSGSASQVAPSPGAIDAGDWISNADRNHPIFSSCKRRDSTWHGTHVSGIVAALAGNAQGVAGAAFGVRVLPIRALGKCGGYMSDVAESIRYAAGVHPAIPNPTPARVLNLSIGGIGSCGATMQAAIDAATVAGALVVVAAGNDGGDAAAAVLASCANVVAVAASTRAGDLASYSNRSVTHVALSAPGGDYRGGSGFGILSTMNAGTTTFDPNGWTYAERVGTSSAAPHVAAAAALLQVRNPALSPAQMRVALTADTSVARFASGSACNDSGACGAGLLDAGRAVAAAVEPLTASAEALRFGGLQFGNLRVGAVARRDLTVHNLSQTPVPIGNARLGGGAGFSLLADQCSGHHLAPGAACPMTIGFAAGDTSGVSAATLLLPTPTGDAALVSVPLTASVGSRLEAAHPKLDAPPTAVGVPVSVEVTFSNLSLSTELLLPLRLTGNVNVEPIDDRCSNRSLGSGESCGVTLRLTPAEAGPYALQVAANTAGPSDIAFDVFVDGIAHDVRAAVPAGLSIVAPAGSGGGGGCTILASGGTPDATLAILALGLLGLRGIRRRRNVRRG